MQWWYLIVALICIFLITYDVEHLFICLFVVYISSSVKCLLKTLVHFLIRLFSLILEIRILCIFWNSPLSDVPFENIFYLWLVFSLAIVFYRAHILFYLFIYLFFKVQITNYFFNGFAFDVVSKKVITLSMII